jgi:phospholipase C
MDTRRDFLKKAITLTGAAGFSAVVPESVQRAFAIEPEAGTSYLDAEHIVILMQENRSFDHIFGSMQGVRGFNDPRAIRLANGNPVFLQKDAAGHTYGPWRLDIKDTRIAWMGSIPHSRESQVDAWNGGNHDGWLDAKRSANQEYSNIPLTMGHYTREDLPFYYALADAFTICDQHHAGAMTSTTPNRGLLWTGTVRSEQNTSSKVCIRNTDFILSTLKWTTYPERLQEAGISWKLYQNDILASGGLTTEEGTWLLNFGTNVLEFFARYCPELSPRHGQKLDERMASLMDQINKLEVQVAQGSAETASAPQLSASLIAKQEQMQKLKADYKKWQAGLSQLPSFEQELHRRAFVTNEGDADFHSLDTIDINDGTSTRQIQVPKGDPFYQFRQDVNSGKLPTISWLAPPEKFSDHPVAPQYGAWYVSEIMDILTKNPEVWRKTIFILTYDENDGYFDHAPAAVAADPRRPETGAASTGIDTGMEYTYKEDEVVLGVHENEARTGPVGLGYRVPMVIASPWSRGGWVNSQLFDHTSSIQFLETFIEQKFKKKVKETNISAWRRTIVGDLTSSFRPYDGSKPTLSYLDRTSYIETIQHARYKEVPSNYKALTDEEVEAFRHNQAKLNSQQEPGIRPSCAIAYEIYSDGHLNGDRTQFEVKMQAGDEIFGSRALGVPFNVYIYGATSSRPLVTDNSSAPKMQAATYVAKVGDVLNCSFALSSFSGGKYDVAVHAPNGFFRGFLGDNSDPAIEVHCRYQKYYGAKSLTGNVEVLVTRKNVSHPYTIQIIDNAYKAVPITVHSNAEDASKAVVLTLEKNHGWYDFSVKVHGYPNFENRYAGRVDTGRPGFTDPLMGGMFERT